MLTADNITFKVGKKILLDDVSLAFHPGRINLVLGPNGAGKTTLLKIIAGQMHHYHGQVMYGSRPLLSFPGPELARTRAVLSQHTELAFPLSVEEVVMMGRYPHYSGKPGTRDKDAVEGAINLFDLEEFRDRDYTTLSGGEKQRVQFARVLAQVWYPVPGMNRILLLDEPLSFLDIHYQLDFMKKIVELLKAGNLLVAGIIHDLHLAAKFADYAILLEKGRVLASGNKNEVFTSELLKKAYGVEAEVKMSGETLQIHFE